MAKKIKLSWFRFWAYVLAFLGIVHSNNADAARTNASVVCGTESTETGDGYHPDYGSCKAVDTDKAGGATMKGGESIYCYCDDTTNQKYTLTCTQTHNDMDPVYMAWKLTDDADDVCVTPECTPGESESSCSDDTGGGGTAICGDDGMWGECTNKDYCNSGYLLVDSECYASCAIDGGTGYERIIDSSSAA